MSLCSVWRPFCPGPKFGEQYGPTPRLSQGMPVLSSGWEAWILTVPFAFRNRLVDILKHNPAPQMSYQVGFCLWLLTFEQEVSEQIQKFVLHVHNTVLLDVLTSTKRRRFDIIPLLVDVAQGAAKEKVIRVIVATFRVFRISSLFPLLRSSTFTDIESRF